MPEPAPVSSILFPGRHHVLTRFQAEHLRALVAGELADTDGSGNVRYSNLRIETSYHGGDPPWAPILDSFDGASRFRYTVNQDRENRTRISYTIIDGTVATESKRGDGVSVRPSLVWLTSSYVACDQTSLTLRVPHEGRADSYVPDR